MTDTDLDADDTDFSTSAEDGSDDASDAMEISNEEIADILPSKTIPEVRNKKGHTRILKPKAKTKPTPAPPRKKARMTHSVEIEEIEDDDSPRRTAARNASISPTSSFEIPNPKKKARNVKKSPIYLFYEVVTNGPQGTPGEDGDVHYRCLHGVHKICTIKKTMRSNLNALVNNLRVHVKPMHQLYCILKNRAEPPTADELAITTGKKRLDGRAEAEYLRKLEKSSENIKKAFEDQQARTTGPWDQEKFEQLLTEWIVTCDQPFDEVEKPEFINMMNFTHHTGGPLNIPKRDGIKQHIMKMGGETIEGLRKMFSKLKGKVCLSLDAWTSSNQYAFLAIVAHYVTNDGQLEEFLINFRELTGEHSGENMAEAVWATLELYGLIGKIIALVMDNASNNNTLMTSLEWRCRQQGIPFSVQDAHMRCMPHTIHLAAIKLLEGIGAISKVEGKKAAMRSGNYQDDVTTPLAREHDNDAAGNDDDDDESVDMDTDIDAADVNAADGVLPAIERLWKIVKAVRASPQRRQSWAREIQFVQLEGGRTLDDCSTPLMLILDVRTRWSSTHQMLCKLWPFVYVGFSGLDSEHRGG